MTLNRWNVQNQYSATLLLSLENPYYRITRNQSSDTSNSSNNEKSSED